MSDTRQQIVDLAEQLIRTRGYNGFSYKDISSALNIRNAAIHYHFSGKKELGVAVIRQTRRAFYSFIEDISKEQDARIKLDRFTRIYLKSQQNGQICFMGALGSSFENLPEEMQTELTEAGDEIRMWVREVLAEGKASGQLRFQGTTESKADAIISSLLASLVLGKVTGDDVLKNTIDQIMITI